MAPLLVVADRKVEDPVTEQTEYATGGIVQAPKPGDPPLLPERNCGARFRYVDHGVTIPRDDVQIVLLDAAPVPADVARALDQIAELFGRRGEQPTEAS